MWWGGGYGGPGMGYGWGGPAFALFSLLLLILVVVGIVLLARALWAGHDHHRELPPAHATPPLHAPPPGRALQLLDERYAKGEIERDEYLQKKHDLSGGP